MTSSFQVHPEVATALKNRQPVVALESTIISHGMPFPQNLETALQVENIVRDNNCVPATIAIIDGVIKIGLDNVDMKKLAKCGLDAHKTSRRDIAYVVSQRKTGATTVSATMLLSHKVGIKVFVTGGIGGVHRGAEETMDISADLTELGRTPVAVVCSGAKSVLDIEKTLEYLETHGVTVVTYGDSDDFPSFYTPKSGFKSMGSVKTPADAAALIRANSDLGIDSGMVIAVPIPDSDAVSKSSEIDSTIRESLSELVKLNVKGKDVTPFLLDRIKNLTKGDSLRANISLVKNNARVGSAIAKSLSSHRSYSTKRPTIIGGTVLDISSKYSYENPVASTSNPGTIHYSMGGVGRNIAEACFRTNGNPYFVSLVGNDIAGEGLLREMKDLGMDVGGVEIVEHSTATYNAFFTKKGEMITAIADMSLLDKLRSNENVLQSHGGPVCFDGNMSADQMALILQHCHASNQTVIFEPTSVPKSYKIFEALKMCNSTIFDRIYSTPNLDETLYMSNFISSNEKLKEVSHLPETINLADLPVDFSEAARKLMISFNKSFIKLGRIGILVGQWDGNSVVWTHIRPSNDFDSVISVTGAGDSFVGAFLSGLCRAADTTDPVKIVDIVRGSITASELSIQSPRAVSERLTDSIFDKISWFHKK